MHVYQVSPPCVLQLASLRSEVVLPEAICCCCRHGKRCIMHVYPISPPCVLQLASLRSEEVVLPEAICCCCRHGNVVLCMCTKFHPHACYS